MRRQQREQGITGRREGGGEGDDEEEKEKVNKMCFVLSYQI